MSFLPSLSPGNVTQRLPTGFKFDNDLVYDRPTGWLDLGINAAYGTTGVPEKVKGLVAIHPNDISPAHNYVAFHLDTSDGSNYTVNWGDGTTETLAHNTTHHHVYDYDAITGDTSTTKSTVVRGYKQAIFEVTLQGSAKFTVIDLNENGPFTTHTNYVYRKGQPILDIFVSSSNATNITLGDSVPLTMCEQVEIRNTSSNRLTTPRFLYAGMKRLQSIPFVPWIYNGGTRDYLYTFAHCQALRFLPDDFASQDKFWFKNPTRLQQAFDSCWNLQYLPEGLFGTSELSSCTSFHAMFRDCRKLKYIPHLGIRTGSGSDTRIDYMFYNCLLLTKIPKGTSLQRMSSAGIDRMFINNRNIKDWSSIFDGTDVLATINYTGDIDMTQTFYAWHSMTEFPFVGQFTRCSDAESIFNGNHMVQRYSPLYTHLDFRNATSIKNAFISNYCLEELPEIKVRSLTDNDAVTSAFQNCRALTSVKITGMIAGPGNGEYYRMFNNCYSLTCIDGVDFSFAGETSDYYQMFHICRDINAIKFPGTFRAGYASPRINVTVANHADISGEYHITEDGTGYAQASGNGVLTVAESSGNYTWTIKDSSDNNPTESSTAASNTQFTPWAADWSGATNAVTFSEVITGFKYTVSGNSGDGLRYNPIKRTQMLEIFNQLHTVGYTATLDIRNNSYTADLTADDKAIATNKGWTLSL